MTSIKTLNSISPVYNSVLDMNSYQVGPEAENPAAYIVRSANMHDIELEKSVLCVGRAGAGTNNIPSDKLAKQGIVVFNTPGANANAVKELVVAALLLASRDIVGGINWINTLKGQEGIEKLAEKGKAQFVGPELMGKKLGVIGLGAIGVKVANAGVALDMDVYGYDPFISVNHAWLLSRQVKHVNTIEEILQNCDYVTIHVPLNDATRHTINAGNIGLMKPQAALLNFSRGELVDPECVINALNEGKLRKYVTDFADTRLLETDNVIAIPHLGASTPESEDNCVIMAARQIDRFIKYGEIVNSVNYPPIDPGIPQNSRIIVLHANVPNMVSAMAGVFANYGINIENMTNKSKGENAVTIFDIDDDVKQEIINALSYLKDVYSVRAVK